MGTSTARRAPTTRLWRQAKVTTVRYFSPENPHSIEAREVVARYVAAFAAGLDQESGGVLAAFRLTRRIARKLGQFCQAKAPEFSVTSELSRPRSEAPLAAAHMIASTWLEADGGLEAAALRPALVQELAEVIQQRYEPSRAVKKFLAAALYHRLVFDLGEPLEGAAAGWRHLVDGLAGIEKEIVNAAKAQGSTVPPPEDWQGLEGWLWVTQALKEMLEQFSMDNSTKK
ncbi:MAG: hypothetical protein QME75_04505 [Deltaproteobacteria bacterium]|nr:hypothetical protein [Deltaproteobacteria bacterium]